MMSDVLGKPGQQYDVRCAR